MLLATILVACESPTGPALPVGAHVFAPPSVYRRWWALTEACAGRTASLDEIQWYVVPGVESFPYEGVDAGGYYDVARHWIVVAEGGQLSGPLLRHEMLHALRGAAGHPRSDFIDRCGGVVTCVDACLRDAGPPPAPDPRTTALASDDLAVSVTVDPARPSAAVDSGCFALVVTVRNSTGRPVVVDLPPSRDAGPPVAYTFDLVGERIQVFGGARVTDASVVRFAAGETKRWIFDLRLGAQTTTGTVGPGTYTVRGGYGAQSVTAADGLVLSP